MHTIIQQTLSNPFQVSLFQNIFYQGFGGTISPIQPEYIGDIWAMGVYFVMLHIRKSKLNEYGKRNKKRN